MNIINLTEEENDFMKDHLEDFRNTVIKHSDYSESTERYLVSNIDSILKKIESNNRLTNKNKDMEEKKAGEKFVYFISRLREMFDGMKSQFADTMIKYVMEAELCEDAFEDVILTNKKQAISAEGCAGRCLGVNYFLMRMANSAISAVVILDNSLIERRKDGVYVGNSAGVKEVSEYYRQLTENMTETFVKKNHDYGNSFEQSLDKFGLVAAACRIGDKRNRIESLMNTDAMVKDESIRDTLLDLANYAVMTMMWIDKIEFDECCDDNDVD